MRPRADTLLVWTGPACSYGCPACPIDAGTAPAGVETAALQQALAGAADGRLVVLIGGEPLLRRDFLRLVAVVRAAGGVPGVVTTGRPLVYPQWRDRLRRAGIGYLRVQLFGTGAAHDRAVAVPGAYDLALAGVRAWLDDAGAAPACDVDVALSTRGGAGALAADVAALGQAIGAARAQIVVAVDPDRPADATLADAAAALAEWNDDPARPLLVWEGPTGVAADGARVAPPRPRFVGAAPRACCLGGLDALARAGGAGEEAPRANSFNYVRTGRAVPHTPDADACTAHLAGAGSDPARQLWLAEDERLVHYATDTGDFTGAEIARVKDDLSHLFLDRAPVGVLDDITEGMRRALPDPTCAPCAHRGACGRRFQLVDEPPFARQEEWIRAHVAALRGRVLDVGCGEQPYHDLLRPLLRDGVVRYTGIDPDRPSLDRARATLPEGRFWQGGIEDFRGQPGSYDHLLSLRSLNHVLDLDEALARMADLLRPGGSLLLIECVPFAMLRTPEQVAGADRAPRAGHQHFRNVASEEVLPLARRRSLVVRAHAPASLATTNQWILLLERA